MNAKNRERQVQLYGLDLLWLLAKRYYDNLPQPSEMARSEARQAGPTAEEIKSEILERLGGASE
jgi:hypothetical protein